MSKYKYICIVQAHGGFDEFDTLPADGEYWNSDIDLLAECAGNVGEIVSLDDESEWASGIEDIRGRIRGEPDAIYAYLDDENTPRYFGISITQ